MYNILIVDDEKIILKSLESKIKRLKELNINNVCSTTDAYKAIEIYKNMQPQIVITDIKMPKIDGIQLIERMQKYKIETKFIVLSGYDDYKYVREAFKLNIVDYLLKPVSMEELKNKLTLSIKILDDNQVKQNIKMNIEKKIDKRIEYNFERIVNCSYLNNNNLKDLNTELQLYLNNNSFCIGCIMFEISPEYIKNMGQVSEVIDNDNPANENLRINYYYNYKEKIYILFNLTSNNYYDDVIQFMNEKIKYLKIHMNLNCIGVISELKKHINSLMPLCRQVDKMLLYKIEFHEDSIIKYSDIKEHIKKKSNKIARKNIQKISIENGIKSLEAVTRFIDKWFKNNNFFSLTIEDRKIIYNEVIKKIEYIKYFEGIYKEAEKKEFNDFFTLGSLNMYLREQIYCVKSELIKNRTKLKTVVDIAKQYIKENFNKDVDMASIANMVSMNYSYFSELFKSETGISFSDYKMQVKMKKATELLENPINRINEISYNIGYENPKHFTRAFKKYYGMSPTQYRKNISK